MAQKVDSSLLEAVRHVLAKHDGQSIFFDYQHIFSNGHLAHFNLARRTYPLRFIGCNAKEFGIICLKTSK
ncbi:MAG TPA: hypothetical protein VE956_21635 [Nodularia sp. (in: cyanobacteria)]|nr:hypothetical protein [Nodularia sp. (in: cyanobacteria)]